MRMIVFFDLPVETAKNRKDYRRFVKTLKKDGFFMMQESVYIKLAINLGNVEQTRKNISVDLPKKGVVTMLTVTEKQFSSMEILLGEVKTDVVHSEERVIEL